MALFSVQFFTVAHKPKTKLIHAVDEDDAIEAVKGILIRHKEYWDEDSGITALRLDSKMVRDDE